MHSLVLRQLRSGACALWILPSVAFAAPALVAPAPTAEQARDRLEDRWEEGVEATPTITLDLVASAAESALPAPQRRSLALTAEESFDEPVTLRSRDGQLALTLVGMKAHNRIGADPVFLRSYNGQLTGPTLRARPGDTIRIRLENRLDPDTRHDGPMNTLHDFNTMNLHTHGLHVSPSGISDNVLLEVPAQTVQDYEIVIPADHPAGTFWYHPHKHGSTAAQVASGMSGALIIEGGIDNIPEIAAARERIFVLQQIPYLYKNCFPDKTQPDGQKCFNFPEGIIEQPYVNYLFGPDTWDDLGRYTTINGRQLPVLRLRPGSVERWRLIHSGMRERLELKLEAAVTSPGLPAAVLPLHMIAADGLPLGKVDTQSTVELWPGYRADVLVQAPAAPGEYLLLDERTEAADSLNNQLEPRKYLARVIVEGAPLPMALPKDAQLAPFRLPSIPSRAVNVHREIEYGIIRNPAGPGILFTINRQAFDAKNVLRLKLGDTEEWTLTSINEVGPVSHPFHIHVNPFEVVSMIDDKGVERLREPIWRDTLILHEAWKVKIRSYYTDYTGAFVQHCHILDHEDQGMMQIVEIYDPAKPAASAAPIVAPPAAAKSVALAAASTKNTAPALPERLGKPVPAPAFSLSDGAGRVWTLADLAGGPALLVFFKGEGCFHCVEQLRLLSERAEDFRTRGVKILAISTDKAEQIRDSLAAGALPFPVVSDSALAAFRAYGVTTGEETRHGLFLLDAAGAQHWRVVSADPFTGFGLVLSEADRIQNKLTASVASFAQAASTAAVGPAVEIQIRDTAAPGDDYIDWASAPARIRLIPGTAPADLPVVLGNDAPRPAPAGRDQPLDGDLAFDRGVAPGRTAAQAKLALTLPKDGSWVPFVVAGTRASTQDKDAVIEVRAAAAPSGPALGRQALMVRVRKDHRKLTVGERARFLDALDYLNRRQIGPDGQSRYMYFVHMHQAAAVGLDFGTRSDIRYYWPDLAHKGPGFIAWHRAFLLLFEREIQKTHPDVALPYWVMSEPSQLFTPDFMGYNPDQGTDNPVAAKFAPDNPLYGWTADIDGARHELLQRFTWGRQPGSTGFPNFFSDDILFKNFPRYSLYPKTRTQGGFVEAMESNPHNIGHNWTGPWMQNCQTSPRDPVFWIFHAGFDRQWAHWQYLYNRFDPTGANDSYCPLGSFDQPKPVCGNNGTTADCNNTSPNPCVPVNHRIDDLLWPWGGQSGQGTSKNNSYPQPDYAAGYIQPFPPSPTPGLWPAAAAKPTCGDMIDYLGLTPGRAPMGFAYDDTPHGAAPAAKMKAVSEDKAVGTFLNSRRPLSKRLDAARTLTPAALDEADELSSALTLVGDVRADDALRVHALRLAHQAEIEPWLPRALELVNVADNGGAELDAEAVRLLANTLMFAPLEDVRREEIRAALAGALSDPRAPVRRAALAVLAPMPHGGAVADVLTRSLQSPMGALFSPVEAITGLALARQALPNAALIRPFLDSPVSAERAAAVAALAADDESRPAIVRLIADSAQPRQVRAAGLHALLPEDAATLPVLLDLIADSAAEPELRAEALATLGVAARSPGVPLTPAQLEEARSRLGQLPAADAELLGALLARTVLDLTRRLETN